MRPTTRYGYLFAQVFEPYVLTEIAELEGTTPELLEALEVGSTPEIDMLRQRIAERQSLSPVEAVNTAAALISISRFALAELLLNAAEQARTDHRDKFEIAMLWFVIHNRRAEYDLMAADLLEMRRLIETGPLHGERKLDAASQAIVWHLKAKVLSATDFEWFLDLGRQIAETGLVDDGALSSWYRAVAMVPAAKGDKDATRKIMLAARKTADNAMKSRLNAYETHFLKTYHESSIKEHMYVSRDYAAAVAEGEALVRLDPAWSVSYGEVGEVHRHFGAPDAAAEYFQAAARQGPPYLSHHLFCAAQCHEAAGNLEEAMRIYHQLLVHSPENPSVIVAGTRLARRTSDPRQSEFMHRIDALPKPLSQRHLEFLES